MTADDTMQGRPTCYAAQRQERPLEIWLRHSLCANHDSVLSEPVPDEWLAMIWRAERRD